jgi:hypothetical protein
LEIDKRQVVEHVAAKLWEASDPLGMKGPLEAQDKMIQYNLKATVLPVVHHALPVAEKHVKEKIKSIIDAGHSRGDSADMILLDISMEVG